MKPLFLTVAMFVGACSATPLAGAIVVEVDAGAADVEAADVEAADAGPAETGPARVPLCDGVAHLRFAAAYVGGGQVAPGSKVRSENGYNLFAVDGNCTYWIAPGWVEQPFDHDLPVRTGKLSDADIQLLEASLPTDDTGALTSSCWSGLALDAPGRSIRAATGTADCGQLPFDEFNAAWTAVTTVATRVANEGTPVDGPLHVSAVRAGYASTVVSYPWPTSLTLDAFILAAGDVNKVGVSRLVDDPVAASQLRTMRAQYVIDATAQPGLHPGDAPLATDQGVTVSVFMRDAIPYEDAQGLLAF
jgi:hypothetical protein